MIPHLRVLAASAVLGWAAASVLADASLDPSAGTSGLLHALPDARPEGAVRAYYGPLDRAAADVKAGRYRLALAELEDEKVDAGDARVTDLRVKALLALGNADHADEIASTPKLSAEVAAHRGDLVKAMSLLGKHLDEQPGDVQSRQRLGELAELRGDREAELAQYEWFHEQDFLKRWQQDPDGPAFEVAEDVVAIARSLDRYATMTGAYRDDPGLHDLIGGMFVRAYDVVDRGNLAARVASADFAYRHSDKEEAAEQLTSVLTANPHHRDALVLLGRLVLDAYNFDKAKQVAEALRATDAESVDADLLEARSILLQRQAMLAEPILRRVLATQPENLDALGLLAAMHAVRLDSEAMQAAINDVEAIDPDNASAHYSVGQQLANLRQYDRAVDSLRVAIEREPWLTEARNELGATLTQAGRELEAIAALDAAVAYDPFNATSLNYLKLLEDMQAYDRQPTEHFIVRWDGEQDALAAELWAEWLDPMHEDVARIYGWEPEIPTEIQIFPTHDRFSVRVAGDPYVGTVGACTGPVVAMVSPRNDGETMGQYDWARVLRHEYTHTITLGRTGNRIWHWMTEGIAVREEQAPPRPTYLDLLTKATLEGDLFKVEDLTWGFVRPRKPTDRSQAYAQSWYVVEYIVERWGEQALLDLLEQCAQGKTEAEGFAEVLDISLEEFDSAFEDRMRQHLDEWGRSGEKSAQYIAAVSQGQAALQKRDFPAATEAFESAHEIRPFDELPIQRLAGLYLTSAVNRPLEAAGMLMEMHVRTQSDNRFAKRAARVYLDENDPANAVQAATAAIHMGPFDASAHRLLLEAAEAAGQTELAEKQKARLAHFE